MRCLLVLNRRARTYRSTKQICALKMKQTDLLTAHAGTIDVFVILEDARELDIFLDTDLRARANIVYFTPSSSHRALGREQKVEGSFSSDRPALIFDTGWWTGASFKETYAFLIKHGYDARKIYGFYLSGCTHPCKDTSESPAKVCDTAENFLKMFKTN